MEKPYKQVASPTSTGGLGNHFENRVQASFVVLMLANGFSPCLPSWPIREIKFQGKYKRYETDDIIVRVEDPYSNRQAKLLGQIKHSLSITNSSVEFNEMIQAAWNDFNNSNVFCPETDIIALICGPLSAIDTNDVRTLLRQAQHSINSEDFLLRVEKANFTSNEQRNKLSVFRAVLKKANGDKELSEDQLWRFLKSYRLLIYDLDIEGTTIALLKTIIDQRTLEDVDDVLAKIIETITWESENAGYITPDSISEEIKSKFTVTPTTTIPREFVPGNADGKVDWNTSQFGHELALMSLLGSWDEKSEYDVEVVRRVTGECYNDWMRTLQDILQLPNSPIAIKNSVWSTKNQASIWETLAPRVFDNTLDRLQKCIVTVLTENDPQFTLPKEQRYAARIYGKNLNHSYSLRKGITQSLALIGCYPEKLSRCSKNDADYFASLCVREIFASADWMLWASLDDLLPTIAEASPNAFLDAVEKGLSEADNPFSILFDQDCGGITGRIHHTGLLWALEGLAWDEKLLVRITMILGELAQLSIGGNWTNKPINSLATIFLPWHPQTLASIKKRFTAIEVLVKENPNVAWNLLISMLPSSNQTTIGSRKPIYRNPISEDWKPSVTNVEYWEQVSTYAEYAIRLAKDNFKRLLEVIKNLSSLPNKAFNEALLQLQSFADYPNEDDKAMIWMELLKLSKWHERFPDAEWSLDSNALCRVKETLDVIQPKSLLDYYIFLFSDSEWEYYEKEDDDDDWETQGKQLEERRRLALRNIIDYGGTDAIFELVKKVETPYKVGRSLGAFADECFDSIILPDLILSEVISTASFVSAYIWEKFSNRGWEWLDELTIHNWSESQKVEFFLRVPTTSEAWRRLDESFPEIKIQYWEKVNVQAYALDFNDLEQAIDKLICYGRPFAAVNCFYVFIHKKQPFDKEKLVNAFISGISSSESIKEINRHHFSKALKCLQDDEATSMESLFRIEWEYFRLFSKYDGSAHKTLEKRLSSDPDFFSKIICLLYRSKDESDDSVDTIDDKKRVAIHNAYNLLNEWQTPPGLIGAGLLDFGKFSKWFKEVKRICLESGRLEVALTHVGKVLYYCPPDTEGFWINKSIAEVLNEKGAEKMRSGYKTEVYNSRGVHSVDPNGKPEKNLAEKYWERAEETEDAGFPRFADTLRDIAQIYEKEAESIIARDF